MRPIFKIEILIYQSKGNINKKILFGKITHHLGAEIRKMLVQGMFENEDSTSHLGPLFTCYIEIKILSFNAT